MNPYKTVFVQDGSSEWRRLRSQGIGGSEVATIMGLNRYQSPYELWLVKTGREKPADLSGVQPVEWGHRLEPLVAQKFKDSHPELVVKNRNATFIDRDHPWRHANIDRQVLEQGGEKSVLEIKTVGAYRAKDWENGIPDYYLTQVVMYCLVTGWRRAYVAALIGGQDYKEFRVEPDESDLAAVAKAVDTFWLDFVKKDVPPALIGSESESKALQSQFSQESDDYVAGTESADDELADWESRKDKISQLKGEIKELEGANRVIENRLKEAIGTHAGMRTNLYKVDWKRSVRTSVDSRKLKKEEPEIFDKYAKQIKTQRFTVKAIN